MIDPGAGVDETTDLLVRDGVVAAVGGSLVPSPEVPTLDVRGLVVGPGFIDLHSHVHSIAGCRLQALDGVTTALDLELGLLPVGLAYERAATEGRPINFGFSASWAMARGKVLSGVEPDARPATALALLGNSSWQRSSSPAEMVMWLGMLREELALGALGIGILLGYAPRSDPAEFLELARLAAEAGAPTFTHVRELVEADPTTPIDGSEELTIAAAETGAHMHHCHVNSTSRRHIDRVLRLLESSRTEGSRVTVEAYPYGSGSTVVGASFLAPESLGKWGLESSDIMLLATGERLASAERLRQVRNDSPDALCLVEFLDETDPVDRAFLNHGLAFEDSIVASDAVPIILPTGETDTLEWPLPPGCVTHPRTAGTFSKAIRQMVRETSQWSWLEAFRRCSWLPGRVLDGVAPSMVRKGHLGAGADADIVILDPVSITDRASYRDSTLPSSGVRHVLVGGTFIVRDGVLVTDALPGRPVRGAPR